MKKNLTPEMIKQIKSFWRWFEQNEIKIADGFLNHTLTNNVMENLNRKLGYVSKRIGIVIIGNKNKKIKLIMTAHGYSKLFPKVKGLISNAPKLNNWEFQAFLQPETDLEKYKNGIDKPFIFNEFEIKTSELYFSPLEFNTFKKNMKIVVYLRNYKCLINNENLDEAIQIIIQNLIGEVSFKKSISFVQLAQLPENPRNLIQLYELNEYIDFLNKINRKVKIEI